MGITEEQLQALIASEVAKGISPLLETQKKYAGLFGENNPNGQHQENKTVKEIEPGITWARMAKTLCLAKNDPEKALFIAKGAEGNTKTGMYSDDSTLHSVLKALSVSTPSEGGFTVPQELLNEVIPLLYAKTAVRELGARTLPMPNGNINIAKITGGAISYYQGENLAATKSQQTFGNVHLSSKKLFTLVPESNDLIRNNSVEADRYIRDDMIMQSKLKMDYAAFYGAGTQFTPLGMKNFTGITKASPTSIIAADDPGTMLAVLMSKNLPMANVGWAFNGIMWGLLYNLKTTTGAYIYRNEMDNKKLLGYPFVVTNQIPVGTDNHGLSDIFLGDFSEFLVGEEIAFEMSASTEATYDNGSGTLISAFSNDQTVIKLLAKHDFNSRHPEAFVCYTFYTK